MTSDDVGKFFKDSENGFWRMVTFCDHPTATLEKVGTKERRSGSVSSLIMAEFTLVPEPTQKELDDLFHQININKFKSKRR